MQDGEGDERVPALLVARRELGRRRPGWGEREVADEAGDEGADGFEYGAGEK